MKRSDYEKVTVGSLVKFILKAGPNCGRVGRVVARRGNDVCIESLEGEEGFIMRYRVGRVPFYIVDLHMVEFVS